MSFRHQNFTRRFTAMGDQAEGVFERVYPEGWHRYGLNRPLVNLSHVPAFVRYTPDYLTAKGLVEVQGFGTDQTLKIKVDKWVALQDWKYVGPEDEPFDVHLFVYDSKNNEYAWVLFESLERSLELSFEGSFDDGTKPYVAWHKQQLPTDDGWHPVEG